MTFSKKFPSSPWYIYEQKFFKRNSLWKNNFFKIYFLRLFPTSAVMMKRWRIIFFLDVWLVKNAPYNISLTYEKISEKMLKMKVIQNFVVNNFYIIHFIDKVCWTSQILDENSLKNVTFFVCFDALAVGASSSSSEAKLTTKTCHNFQEFSPWICEVQQTLSLKWII